MADTLKAGESLRVGQELRSANGKYLLILQGDGTWYTARSAPANLARRARNSSRRPASSLTRSRSLVSASASGKVAALSEAMASAKAVPGAFGAWRYTILPCSPPPVERSLEAQTTSSCRRQP
jgi:hypothetical protein